MLTIHVENTQFTITHNHRLLFCHTPESPMFFIGKGNASFQMDHGNFLIDRFFESKIPLPLFTVQHSSEEKTVIHFSHETTAVLAVEFIECAYGVEARIKTLQQGYNRFWIRSLSEADECIYGCGEQFSALNLKGKRVPLWTSEQGVGRNKKEYVTFLLDKAHHGGGDWYTTYFPQPTFVSSNSYYIHVGDSSYMEFDFRNSNFHELEIWGIPEKILFGAFDSLPATIEHLTSYLGRQIPLPDWSLDGVWLGLQGGTQIVLPKVENALKKGLKIAGIWIQDWEGKRITTFGKQLMWNWEYHREMYPDLPKTIEELKNRNIRVLGYINTFLALEGNLYREASKEKLLVMNRKGEEYHVVITTFPAALLDLTNPRTREWIKTVITRNLIGIGLSGWMCDFGEYLPTDAVLYSGEDAEHYHNQYPAVWAQVNREAIQQAGKEGEIVFFTRAGFTGSSKYSTLGWAGDQNVDWSMDDGLPSVIPGILSAGFCGMGINHSDTGGYTTIQNEHISMTRSKELFMRWAEFSAFTPVMRTHEGNRPDLNWQFDSDQETLDHFARMSRIYVTLKPYLKQLFKEHAQTGMPVMRHPVLHYPKDQKMQQTKYQYMLGRDLFCAPVIQPGIEYWKVELPMASGSAPDAWIHLWSGKEYSAETLARPLDKDTGGVCVVPAAIGQPPVFYRKGSDWESLFRTLSTIL